MRISDWSSDVCSSDLLTLSLARKQPNGNNRSPSPYLDWLPGGRVSEIARPAMVPAPESPSSLGPISIAWPKDWALTDSRLGAYEKCPRRFFYTHEIGRAHV